jgi:hypothetical protein
MNRGFSPAGTQQQADRIRNDPPAIESGHRVTLAKGVERKRFWIDCVGIGLLPP